MIGSINLELLNIWQSFWNFKKGKNKTAEFYRFEYNIENNLNGLNKNIIEKNYRHGFYRTFFVCDNKKRKISEPQIRDKIVHRLIYDLLLPIYNKTFDFDVWSCRPEKGLVGALDRTKFLIKKNPDCFLWKTDISKFFDNVDHFILLKIIRRKISNETLLYLIEEVLRSFNSGKSSKKGIPLGNLTSQIFANIYLNELDRFIRNEIKPLAYLRYGDDFIVIMKRHVELTHSREKIIEFLERCLKLKIKANCDIVLKTNHNLKFLGMIINSEKIILNKRNRKRVISNLKFKNISSYFGLAKKFGSKELQTELKWKIFDILKK